MRRTAFLVAAFAFLVSGCSPLTILNWVNPETAHDRVEVAYGPNPRQRLDLYRPKGLTRPAPVVVFFYGGGWEAGEKSNYRFAALSLVEYGFVVAVPDYRVYPEVKFPAFLEDAAKAAAWIRANAGGQGGDTSRLFLMGHSAGAYNAAMLALDPRYLAAEDVPATAISGVVGLSGPYDFLPLTSDTLKEIFAVSDRAATQPITFARKDAPPMLLATGTDDDTVYPRNTRNLARRLNELGADIRAVEYPGVGHAGTVLALTPFFRNKAPVLGDTLAFLKSRSEGK